MGVRRARGPAPAEAEAQAARYCVRRAGGRGLVRRAPLFSPDAQSLLVIAQSVVRVYNVKTAECSRVLESEGESSDLVSIGFPHDEENNLYGCSDRGRVTVWNWEKGSVLKEKNLELPDNIEVLTFDVLNRNECFITGYNTVSNATYLAKFCLKTGDLLIQYEAKNVKRSQIWQVTVGWNKEDRFSVVCNGSRFLYACDLSRPHAVVRRPNYNDIRILSVSAHPNESAVVTGDALGRAIIWKGDLFSNNVAREQLHWHSLPLIAVAFSLQGSYLLTGGMEKVVVKWQLGNVASKAQQRDTMPRLPGAVRFLVSNNTNIAIVMNNNAIAITTPQLGLVSTIMECGGLSHITRSLGPGLVYHKPLGSLLLGGRTGHLQVFSTASQKVLYNVDITGLNDIPANRYNLCPADTEVSCAAVSADGTWLVTSEYRSDGITYPEERLKFWSATPSSTGPFTLNTCVNLSHGGCNVISIAINNTGDFCVSAGTDQKFRIWKRETNILSNKKKISWSCLTACYYASGIGASLDYNVVKSKVIETENEFNFKYLRRTENNDVISRVLGVSEDVKVNENDVGSIRQKEAIEAELEMGGVAISQDGSLIAAWFGSKLTLWDTYSCSLRNTLSHPSLRPKGVDVQFGNEDAAHYLVCTTENCVAVWNLLSLTVRWLVNLRPVTLTADPSSNRMAVVTENNDVFVFTPHQATPLLSRKSVLSPSSGVIRHCAFGPSRHELEFRLYMMRNDSEMYCLEPESSPEGPALETVSRINLPASNYSALVAEKQTSGVKRLECSAKEYLDTNRLGKTALAEFFSSAPHMVPSVSLLCTSFLEHLSGFKRTEDPPEDVSVASEEPNSSDDEGMDSQTQSIGFQAKKVELWRPNYEDTKEKKVRKILREPELSASLTNSLLQ